ncbi:hypothetical protein BKA62DRAFT_805241 [Auriculariales sp. MPI-PUGE-AT-0066]|nr:hypothetical protein BKA62DRAFT_805241 [Auriculariales sp. MPI-PUGE-AT-0066]
MPAPTATPASGRRIPLSAAVPFPPEQYSLRPPCLDVNGSPAYLGTAYINHGAYPCKIVPSQNPACRVAMNGQEIGHVTRYDLLPFDPAKMELVRASNGQIPRGRRPIHGGHEEDGRILYHAIATIANLRIAGKTGEHLSGACVLYSGRECIVADYDIVCWRT